MAQNDCWESLSLIANQFLKLSSKPISDPSHPSHQRMVKMVSRIVFANRDIPEILKTNWTGVVLDDAKYVFFILPVILNAIKDDSCKNTLNNIF